MMMRRKYWVYQVHLNINRRKEVSSFAVARELGQDSERKKSFYRIKQENFKLLADLVGGEIKKQETDLGPVLEPGYIIPCVSNPEDEKFCVCSIRYPVQCFHRPSFIG
jgi:hypothetical protein